MPHFKPLNWEPKPGVGYSVIRRSDGGMTLTFTDLSPETVADWYAFASEHLLNADRLTRNLYDLRQVKDIPAEAIQRAVDLNNDPATRNIRLAVVVSTPAVKEAILKIADYTPGSGAEIHIFTDINEAEAWLAQPLDELV